MASSAQLKFELLVTLSDGSRITFPPSSSAETVTATGLGDDAYYDRVTVPDASAVTIWDFATDTADFSKMVIVSSQDVALEFTVDSGGEVGTVTSTLFLRANWPFLLARDDAYAGDYVSPFAAGTADKIERVRIANGSGSAAIVQTLVVTT